MAAQAVAVGNIIAPERFLQLLAPYHRRAFLHEDRQQFVADGIQSQRLPGAGCLEGIEVIVQITDMQFVFARALSCVLKIAAQVCIYCQAL